jgi:hypothetical protein
MAESNTPAKKTATPAKASPASLKDLLGKDKDEDTKSKEVTPNVSEPDNTVKANPEVDSSIQEKTHGVAPVGNATAGVQKAPTTVADSSGHDNSNSDNQSSQWAKPLYSNEDVIPPITDNTDFDNRPNGINDNKPDGWDDNFPNGATTDSIPSDNATVSRIVNETVYAAPNAVDDKGLVTKGTEDAEVVDTVINPSTGQSFDPEKYNEDGTAIQDVEHYED